MRLETDKKLVVNIISIYFPAQGSPESLDASLDDLCNFIESREDGSITIICGDANCDMGFLGGSRGKGPPTNRGKKFFDLVNSYNLEATNLQR